MQRLAALALLLCSTTACARASGPPLVDMQVIDRDAASTLPQYPHRGERWVPGTPGHRYSVQLHNRTGARVLVVLSVDGVNAVSGQTASPSQAGYVLEPWQSTEIAGWRKSMDDVAQFVFTDLPDSYAARTGRPDNVGVIGVAVFEERVPPPAVYAPAAPPPVAAESARAKAAPARDAAANAEAMPQSLGTGHGAREWSPVGSTTFERASRAPSQVLSVRYDDARALQALGIIPAPWRAPRGPDPFPAAFVPDPPEG